MALRSSAIGTMTETLGSNLTRATSWSTLARFFLIVFFMAFILRSVSAETDSRINSPLKPGRLAGALQSDA